jgi:hypothetical protein
VILRTGEALTTEAWWPLALLGLVVDEHIVGVVPARILVQLTLLLQASRQVECLLREQIGRRLATAYTIAVGRIGVDERRITVDGGTSRLRVVAVVRVGRGRR